MRLDDPMSKIKLLVERIRVSIDSSEEMIVNKAKEKMKRAGIHTSTLHFRLYKKSIDARKKDMQIIKEVELRRRDSIQTTR